MNHKGPKRHIWYLKSAIFVMQKKARSEKIAETKEIQKIFKGSVSLSYSCQMRKSTDKKIRGGIFLVPKT
jgi:hypothetical protein